jgi:hypothetical protein
MWVSKSIDWHANHTELTKYFFEKIKQQVDYDEVLSNKHRTTNGFTLVKEIIDVSSITLKRRKSYKRLESLLSEATEKSIKSNIKNDHILKNYHSDIQDYYVETLNKIKDDENVIKDIHQKSKIFYYRLEKQYFENIKSEVRAIDYVSGNFNKESRKVDNIIDNLIPYLLFVGYSPTSISDIAFHMIRKDFGITAPNRFLSHFNNQKFAYQFLIIVDPSRIESKLFEEYFQAKGVSYKQVNGEETVSVLKYKSIRAIESNEVALEIDHFCTDPHNFIRNLYEKSIRNFLLEKSRNSLSYFNTFFENVFWRFNNQKAIFRASNIKVDPINICGRKSTLFDTLTTIASDRGFTFEDKLPHNTEIQDSVYYYNLALGSKSIENSLLLLWSSLEALVPYRFKATDIENVQYFVAKSLSVGAIGRLVASFAKRLLASGEFNSDINAKNLGINLELSFKPEKFSYWAFWLCDSTKATKQDDPYNFLKPASNLLCSQYVFLNELFSGLNHKYKVKDLSDRITASHKSIEFQLDRIYLHRNQIVHSGKFINEYSNLWLHLEWYVGKLLSYCFLKIYEVGDSFDKEKSFMELEGDHDLLLHLLKKHKDEYVKDFAPIFYKLFQHTWQFS